MLSIIIVSFNRLALLERCLGALESQAPPPLAEIIVVRDESLEGPERQALERRFTKVHWLGAAPNSTVPQMRGLGWQASQGDLVALLEDDCLVDPAWVEGVIKAHQEPFIAIGGAVEPGPYLRGLDWAVYFCEYARFMLPPPAGAISALPGNNVSYKRAALAELLGRENNDTIAAQGFYDVFIHQSLLHSGQRLKTEAGVVVHNINTWKFVNVSSLPFHHGRGFAAMRVAAVPWWRRAFLTVLTLGLPALQIMRLLQQVFSRRRWLWQLGQALPWIALFYGCWSAGEFVGYLAGPGNSLERWR